jgi:hypothetical protein
MYPTSKMFFIKYFVLDYKRIHMLNILRKNKIHVLGLSTYSQVITSVTEPTFQSSVQFKL